MNLGLGLNLGGVATRGGSLDALGVVQANDGALLVLDAGQVYQDRSVTPSTVANVGDEVGTIVGLDETWFAVATSDADRATLREDSSGNRYLETSTGGQRFLVQDSAGVFLTLPETGHTVVDAPVSTGSQSYNSSRSADRGAISMDSGDINSSRISNDLAQLRRVAEYIVHDTPHVATVFYSLDEVSILIDNKIPNGAETIPGYDYSALGPIQLAIGSRRSNLTELGPTRRWYGGAYIPSVISTADAGTIFSALASRVYPSTGDTNDVLVDFNNSEFEWGGSSRVLGDLTDNLDGSLELSFGDWSGGPYIISIDLTIPDATAHADNTSIIELTDGANVEKIEVGETTFEFYQPGIDAGQAAAKQAFGPGNLDQIQGVHRATFYVEPGKFVQLYLSGYNSSEFQFRRQHYDQWTAITIWEDFSSGNVLSVRAQPGVKTEAQQRAYHQTGIGQPVIMVGDSFVVFGEGSQAALQRVAGDTGYLFVAGDGVGGATLPDHRDRFLAYTSESDLERYEHTLIIEDGGWAQTDNAADIAAIQDMVDELTHDRWIYLEPWYDSGQGSATTAGINFRAGQAVIQAEFPDNYVETTKPAQAAHLNLASSISQVEDGLIPTGEEGNRDMRTDSVHPTSPRGYTLRNRVTLAALARRGYVSGITLSAPGAPTNFSETSLDLSWDLPADEGNDPVHEFTVSVEDSPGAGTFTDVYTGQVRRHTLTGLSAGTYDVRVTATNPTGTGSAAEISVTVT